MKGGIQNSSVTGKEGCRKAGVKESIDAGKERFKR